MKITFYSNYLNHHQIPFSNELYNILGDDYTFVATTPMEEERKMMGWISNPKYPYEIRSYENNISYDVSMRLAIDSDVIIVGSAPEIYVTERMKYNKLTFRYGERVYKRGRFRAFSPRGMYFRTKEYFRYKNKELYMLCSSGYAASDLAILGSYIGKCYKWGYFPEFKKYDIERLINEKNKNKIIEILWVGRLLDWKHPEQAIELAKRLKEKKYKFILRIIGDGPMKQELAKLIKEYSLAENVSLLESMSPDSVREYMEKANIFLFTSDYQEGWGAVLNEAMNSGCAVIASHAIGSVPYLIIHNKNGLVYKNKSLYDLFQKTILLLENKQLCANLGLEAYFRLKNIWNAKTAANNILELCELLIKNEPMEIEDGPCSRAPIIHQGKMYKKLIKNGGKSNFE